ncbi:MAG: radical SAM family heme chaperone HemW [Pseudomonadales bacterium]|nr:radical SAM family heme chaperone HemW [Pseudomonadales bacterium]MCP5213443.1 radical SAM family heme chaperone HemW [Pseudomonadales bacterium]
MPPTFKQLPPLSLYIHIPWCIKKCPYCDFNSHAITGDLPEQAYIAALLADLDREIKYVQGRPLESIFFGGGTPSLLSVTGIDTILRGVAQRINFSDRIEITLEANPGTFERDKFAGFRQAGINRLSVGVQSFNPTHLKQLGRIHSAEEAIQAIVQAKESGFDNINIDLMHGLPRQSTAQALEDLQAAIVQNPAHISWYQLTIEPNTEFYSNPPRLPDDDQLHHIEQQGLQLLAQHDYQQYEISAYSKAGRESLHNLNYWRFGDYLGIGAGAHGKITLLDEQLIIRTRKSRQPKDYLNVATRLAIPPKTIPPISIPGEFMMNALRLNQGFAPELFEQNSGLPLSSILPLLNQAQQDGLLEVNDKIITTRQGRLFLNNLLERFI